MNEKNDFTLVPKPPSGLGRSEPGAKRILSGMVADTLVLAKKEQPHQPPRNADGKPSRIFIGVLHHGEDFVESYCASLFSRFEGIVVSFQDGKDPFEVLLCQKLDLMIITDLNRPALRLLAERNVTYPILVCSGLDDPKASIPDEDLIHLNLTFLQWSNDREDLLRAVAVILKSRANVNHAQ